MRPLDFLGRIKVKLGIVIVLAVGTAFVVNEVGIASGLSSEVRIAVAVVLALIMVQLLAMGMTKPLRQMASAAQTIAKGSYTLRVNATSRDEVGELARAFNAMAADLGEVDRQRRELVANVSHELRTPITGLRAVLENVVDGVSAPDPVTMSTALAQTERLGRLVAQLLDLSRLDSGVRLIEPEPVELARLAEQAVREASLARDDVTVRSAVPAWLGVRADPDLLAQVLSNLLDNAVRHSPPGGVVTVTGVEYGESVRLAVADPGPGIPAAARERVFERFSRLDAGRTVDGGGAGLGLSIVKEIVELHGGSIRIDDCPGCRMVVELPGRTTMADTPLPHEPHTGDERLTSDDTRAPRTAGTTSEAAPASGPVSALGPVSGSESVSELGSASGSGLVSGSVSGSGSAPGPDAGSEPGADLVEGAVVKGDVEGPQPGSVQDTPAAPAVAGAAERATGGSGERGLAEDAATWSLQEPGRGAGPATAGGRAMDATMPGGFPPVGASYARMFGGGTIGVLVGFVVGMVAAVIVGIALGAGFAIVTLAVCVGGMGAVGVAMGAGSARRAAEAAYRMGPYRGQAGTQPAPVGGHGGPAAHPGGQPGPAGGQAHHPGGQPGLAGGQAYQPSGQG
ncbi:sensor histidine kinase, partial [Nonomuraea mesophila]|uniref:sensor histidine kinase n=1 Tax=Nonomuraea mesophila TaxID=2530382 RepID=UPI001FE6C352